MLNIERLRQHVERLDPHRARRSGARRANQAGSDGPACARWRRAFSWGSALDVAAHVTAIAASAWLFPGARLAVRRAWARQLCERVSAGARDVFERADAALGEPDQRAVLRRAREELTLTREHAAGHRDDELRRARGAARALCPASRRRSARRGTRSASTARSSPRARSARGRGARSCACAASDAGGRARRARARWPRIMGLAPEQAAEHLRARPRGRGGRAPRTSTRPGRS